MYERTASEIGDRELLKALDPASQEYKSLLADILRDRARSRVRVGQPPASSGASSATTVLPSPGVESIRRPSSVASSPMAQGSSNPEPLRNAPLVPRPIAPLPIAPLSAAPLVPPRVPVSNQLSTSSGIHDLVTRPPNQDEPL